MQNLSYVQTEKHVKKSEKFQVITPENVTHLFEKNNFKLIHMKIGKAKKIENSDFQTSLVRFRNADQFCLNDLNLDIIMRAPHLYGSVELILGLFRLTCSNQLNFGTHLSSIKIKHIGDIDFQIKHGIENLLFQRGKLKTLINTLKDKSLDLESQKEVANVIALERIGQNKDIIAVKSNDLLRPFRYADSSNDLWTILNVIQENIFRVGVHYRENIITPEKKIIAVNSKTKIINAHSKIALDFNSKIFEKVKEYV